MSLQRTLREALRSHPASVPVLAERLDARQPWADALIGWVFIAFAVAVLLVGAFEPGSKRDVVQVAIVGAIVGATILFYVRWAKQASARPAAAAEHPSAPMAPAATKVPRRPSRRSPKAR
jgi:quinol-cytochrome oxidoreductase complex cytochrome b subunit